MNTTTYGGVTITWHGHSSVMLQWNGLLIYIDPYVLPKNPKMANVILHTHPHYDHCVQPQSIIGPNTVVIGRGCKHAGRDIRVGESVSIGGAVITAVDAYNIGKEFHPKGVGAGFILDLGGTKIYHAGDTDEIPEMAKYKCDVALLPIGGTYTMDAFAAARAAAMIKPKIVIPIHFNYVSGTTADPVAFKKLVEGATGGKVGVRLL
jgi:L-ascorbate metabolism protein UlaG (beta-lactamase superfamily)